MKDNPTLTWLFFSFKGRIARQSYILSIVFIQILFFVIIYQIVLAEENENKLAFLGLVFIGLAATAFWSGLALSVKRLNDLDLPWVLVGLLFFPPITWVFTIFLMAMPSKQEVNRHGPPPFPKTGSNNE